VAQAALALSDAGVSAADVHRASQAGTGRDAHHDRLRATLAVAVEDGRDQSEVAAAHGVSWPTVQRAVVIHAAAALVEPEPTSVLGMDETRFNRPRWLPDGEHDDGRIRWRRTDPWETGFVDITGDQALLGQVDGPTSAVVQAWLAARTCEFRAAVEVVVIGPHPATPPRSAPRYPTLSSRWTTSTWSCSRTGP